MDAGLSECWNCRRQGKFHCERCKLAFYCSQKCKQTDRFRHEVECETVIKSQTCEGCGAQQGDLLKCGACFQAFYCSKTCQTNDWSQHKIACNKFTEKVIDLANVAISRQLVSTTTIDLPWYIGLTTAEDYLRLHQNEGTSTEQELRLLFVGAGDIKDVVRTITDLPNDFNGHLHFVLNDIDPHVSARNMLCLYCALVHPAPDYLVQIWYSLYLAPDVLNYLLARLKELLMLTLEDVTEKMKNYFCISFAHWKQCIQIWKGWYELALDIYAAEKLGAIRHTVFERLLEGLGVFTLFVTIPKDHLFSIQDFIGQGLLLPLGSPVRREALFPNCTMACYNPFNPKYKGKFVGISKTAECMGLIDLLDPSDEMTYGVRRGAHVLRCWDYLVVKKTVGKKDDVLDMYLTYLTKIFQIFINKISSGCVTFRFIVDDFRHLDRYLAETETFDRISLSNLSDDYYFPFLLKQFGPRLNRNNDCSVLITRHENWANFTEVYKYISEATDNVYERALKDIRQRKQVLEGVSKREQTVRLMAICAEDYYDTTPFLLCSLLSEVVAHSSQNCRVPPTKKMIQHPAHVAKELGLRLRNYYYELNHVVPFKRESNTRHISSQKNNMRYLEWTIAQKPVSIL